MPQCCQMHKSTFNGYKSGGSITHFQNNDPNELMVWRGVDECALTVPTEVPCLKRSVQVPTLSSWEETGSQKGKMGVKWFWKYISLVYDLWKGCDCSSG